MWRAMHGILMFLGWGIFLPAGVIIARFKELWSPNGLWFSLHRGLQSLGFAGFRSKCNATRIERYPCDT